MNLKRVFTWIVAPFLVAALLLVAMVSFGQDGHLAYAAKSINVKQSTLANPKCEPSSPNEWHFVINQIDKASNVPASITVSWNNGATEVVPLQKYTGGTAHYSTTSNLGANVTGATTTIYDKWGGQFNLSHGPCVLPLAVSKTAETSYIRTYTWGIEKVVVGPDYAELPVGTDSATFNYQVTVTADGGTDSDFAVTGVITISNPNGYAATITAVSDLVSPDIAAAVDCGVGFPYVLGGNSVLNCSYSADLPDATARVNTATVATSGKIPGGSGSADVIFGEPSDILDECVDVSDDLYGPLGTVCVDQSPAVFDYALTFTRDDIAACDTPTSFTNTASFLTNDLGAWGSSSATVTVVKFCPVVAQWCSPGFWSQNYPNLVGTPYDITGLLGTPYSSIGGAALKDGAPADPTIGDVLTEGPSVYGGPAFNSVANYFASVFGWGGTQDTGENCPIDAHGNLK